MRHLSYHSQLLHVLQSAFDHSVYQNNQHMGRYRALINHYPVVMAFLEEDLFPSLAAVYARTAPSKYWDINTYGQNFSELLLAQGQGPKANLVNWNFASWLAELEYALLRLYYSRYKNTSKVIQLTINDNYLLCQFLGWADIFRLHYPWFIFEQITNKNIDLIEDIKLQGDFNQKSGVFNVEMCCTMKQEVTKINTRLA